MIAIYIYITDLQSPDIRYAWEVRNGDAVLKRGAARSASQAAAQADQWLDINGYRRMA